MPENSPENWLTIDEAASYLHVSPQTMRGMIHDREIQAARVGKRFLLERRDLDLIIKRRKKFQPAYRRGTRPAVAAYWAEYRAEKGKS
jgi:excisionase family DNA binding protein